MSKASSLLLGATLATSQLAESGTLRKRKKEQLPKGQLTPKQWKARMKSKRARQARKLNRT